MRQENQKMKQWLAERGVDCRVKWIKDGSLKRSWRLYNPNQKWSLELAEKLNELGFSNLWFKPLGKYDGNGGEFSVFVRGHEDIFEQYREENRVV